jgi:hypothetical protein
MPLWARRLIGRANAVTPLPGFTEEELITAWERCEGRCGVSGLEFSEVQVGGGKARRPYAPSLDRIDPRRGYEPDNVRPVCAVANFAMNAWGLQPVLPIVGVGAPVFGEKAAEARDIPGPAALADQSELQKPPLTVERDRGRAAVSGGCH